jgi:hypothetical protein
VLGSGDHVLLRAIHRERHHPLLRLVGLGRRFLAAQVRREREESRAREPLAERPDVVIQTPPLLQDDDSGCVAYGGLTEITGRFGVGRDQTSDIRPLTVVWLLSMFGAPVARQGLRAS